MKKGFMAAMALTLTMAMMTGCQSSKAPEAPEKDVPAQTTEEYENKLEKIKAEGKIVLGTSPDFAPSEFQNISSGKIEYVGSDIELAKYIAEQLEVELEIKPMEFMAIQQGIMSDVVDMGISAFAYTEERAETLGLSDFYNKQSDKGHSILVMKDKASDYKTAEDFSGKKIAAQNASLQQTLVENNLPDDVELKPISAITDGILMLTSGKIDGLAVAVSNGEQLIASYPEIALTEFKFDHIEDGNVLAVKKGEDELLEAINDILAEVNEKGLYEQWRADAIELAKSLNIDVK